jgi:uncharacterized pyridoxamine 5'-phosphate oxidase family protein
MFAKSEKKQVLQFLQENHLAVLATVNPDDTPATATIYYVADKKGVISFITKNKTTKYSNLLRNNAVSLTVVDEPHQRSATVAGRVTLLEDSKQVDETVRKLLGMAQGRTGTQSPIAKLTKGDFVAFQLKPGFLSFADYSQPIGKGTTYVQEIEP